MSRQLILIPLALSLVACGERPAERPAVRIVSHDYDFAIPARIPAGLVHFRLVNDGPDIHEAMVVRLSGSGTAAGYVDSVRADVDFPAFGEDMGGTGLTSAGDSNESYMHLEPGHYAMVCWVGDHLRRGMARDFVVEADSTPPARPPAADLTIELTEYGYRFSGPVTAGHHLIRVRNLGIQPHESDLARLEPGKTVRDYIAWLESNNAGPPPARLVGGVGDFVSGREVFMAVDLQPGRYLVICEVPDANGGKPHYALGMTREFEVR